LYGGEYVHAQAQGGVEERLISLLTFVTLTGNAF
jgi:hypothetical protein